MQGTKTCIPSFSPGRGRKREDLVHCQTGCFVQVTAPQRLSTLESRTLIGGPSFLNLTASVKLDFGQKFLASSVALCKREFYSALFLLKSAVTETVDCATLAGQQLIDPRKGCVCFPLPREEGTT